MIGTPSFLCLPWKFGEVNLTLRAQQPVAAPPPLSSGLCRKKQTVTAMCSLPLWGWGEGKSREGSGGRHPKIHSLECLGGMCGKVCLESVKVLGDGACVQEPSRMWGAWSQQPRNSQWGISCLEVPTLGSSKMACFSSWEIEGDWRRKFMLKKESCSLLNCRHLLPTLPGQEVFSLRMFLQKEGRGASVTASTRGSSLPPRSSASQLSDLRNQLGWWQSALFNEMNENKVANSKSLQSKASVRTVS